MTAHTLYLVCHVTAAKRAQAISALEAATGLDVASYPVRLEHALLPDAYADWSAARADSIAIYLDTARSVCGPGVYTYLGGVHTYLGDGGGWCAWPREATPSADLERALAWLNTQGYTPAPVVI